MPTGRSGEAPSSAIVAAEIALFLLAPPILFGLIISQLVGSENVVSGVLIGGATGLILAKLRREVYGLIGR